jgi:hypothetical protein
VNAPAVQSADDAEAGGMPKYDVIVATSKSAGDAFYPRPVKKKNPRCKMFLDDIK